MIKFVYVLKKLYFCTLLNKKMLPLDFLDSMRKMLGIEAEPLFRSLETEPVTSIRLNDKKDVLTFPCDTAEVPWNEEGYYLTQRPQFTLDPLFHAGCYYVQEASSMFLQQVLEQYVPADSVVLDLCAAPGGKATLISQYVGDQGLLVANEVNRSRVFVLSENVQKWGAGNTIVTHNNPDEIGYKCANLFDCIVVDAPCSGEGMFRKDREARNEWSLKNVKMCAERQRKILTDVWDALKPGGVLIYSTCTFNLQENDENMQWASECLGATVLPVRIDPSWHIVEMQTGYHFFPHLIEGEGFYICALRKDDAVYSPYKIRVPKKPIAAVDGEKQLLQWLQHPDRWTIRQADHFMTAYPKKYNTLVDSIREQLTCISAGFGIGELRGKFVAPQHSLSMAKDFRKEAFPIMPLSAEKALAYLRTESLAMDENLALGVYVLTYEDVPLGFAKNVGNRLNNLYPNEWRIRKL